MAAPEFEDLFGRVRDAASSLGKAEAADAHRALDLAFEVVAGGGSDTETAHAIKLELQRLAELLGRRGSHALPAATLARATLAILADDPHAAEALRRECDQKLVMLGF